MIQSVYVVDPATGAGHKSSSHWGVLRWSRRGERTARVPVDGRYKVTSSLAVRDALRTGFGLSLIPWIYVREDVEEGRLCTVLDEWSAVRLSVYAIYPSRRHVVPKVRAFLDFLVEELGGEPDVVLGGERGQPFELLLVEVGERRNAAEDVDHAHACSFVQEGVGDKPSFRHRAHLRSGSANRSAWTGSPSTPA